MKIVRQLHTPAAGKKMRVVRNLPIRIALSMQDGIILISPGDILYCCAESNYTHIFITDGGHHIVSKSLCYVEACLVSTVFCRIHQSHLVNLNALTFISKDYVRMADGKELSLSRAKRKMLLEQVKSASIHI